MDVKGHTKDRWMQTVQFIFGNFFAFRNLYVLQVLDGVVQIQLDAIGFQLK